MLKVAAITGFIAVAAVTFATYTADQNAKLRANVSDLTAQVGDLKTRLEAAQEQGTRSYERASSDCRQAIRAAVAAVRVPAIEVPRYDESGNTNPMCPAVRLSDIQSAGASGVPAGVEGDDTAGAESPR